jgi:ribonuclease III
VTNSDRTRFTDQEFQAIAALLGYTFRNRDLLKAALTHGSGRKGKTNTTYQRLEFLGDRVLGLVIAEELYVRNPRKAEGALAQNFSVLVRAEACADAARDLNISEHIRVGQKEKAQGMATQTVILGDVMESILGAMYLDGGLEPARALIMRLWDERLSSRSKLVKDAKSFLQEWALAQGKAIPAYRIVSRDGPDHSPNFTIAVTIEGFAEAVASAQSKRNGEQLAAELFLRREKIRK